MVRMGLIVGLLVGVTMAFLGCSGSRGSLAVTNEGAETSMHPDAATWPDASTPPRGAPAALPDAMVALDASVETPVPGACALGELLAGAGEVALAAFAPDGRSIATVVGRDLKLWNAGDRSLRWTQSIDVGTLPNPQMATFTSDSSRVLVIGAPPRFLSVTDGREVGKMMDGGANTVAISPDGTLVAGGCQCSGSAGARLWRVSTGTLEPALGAKDEQAFAVAFSPDGSSLAVRAAYPVGAGLPGTSVWRLSDLTRLWDADREPETPSRLAYNAFSPDGTLLVSLRPVIPTADPFLVRVRRVSDGTVIADLEVIGRPRQAVFAPDGKTIVVAAADGLHVYDTASWMLVRDVPGTFLSAGFSPDGRTLIAGGSDGSLRFFCP